MPDRDASLGLRESEAARRGTLIFVGLILVLAVLAPACRAGGWPIRITAADDGGMISLERGATFEVTLEANPSTGFTWEPGDFDPRVIRAVGDPDFQPGGAALGSAGLETRSFEALEAGETTLELSYRRPWETDVPPAATFRVTIVVVE